MKKAVFASLTVAVVSALGLSVAQAEVQKAPPSPKPVRRTYTTRYYPVHHARGFVRQKSAFQFFATTPRVSFTSPNAKVPAAFSLRNQASPVEDQGQCGSCWDFSLTTALRDTLLMHDGKDPGRLSFNYLLNCDTQQQGCNGGDFTAASMLVTPQGAPKYGSDGDYTAMDSQCVQEPPVASAVSYKLLGNDGGEFPNSPTPSFQDIAYVVGVLHQPVSIDIAADYNFESYSDGVYNTCSDETPSDINHMVVIEGYDCETSVDQNGNCVFDKNGNLPPGVGTWLIRNSWGTSWGDNGYITMNATDSSGNKCDEVASDALYFDVK